jgi:hypothetical protein
MLLETPSHPSQGAVMDFVTDLPESQALGYTTILVNDDRLTEMVIYLPGRKDIDSLELALLFFEHAIWTHRVPGNIVRDHHTHFIS